MDGIDLKKQAEEIGIDVKNLIDLFQLFIEQTEDDIIQLNNFFSEKNRKGLKDTAHHIKGASLNLELYSIVDIARDIEKLAEKETWDELSVLLSEINDAFKKMKISLDKAGHE